MTDFVDIGASREIEVRNAEGFAIARLDVERHSRSGAPEAIFAHGKTTAETLTITEALVQKQGHALVTKAKPEIIEALKKRWPTLQVAPHAGAALAGEPPEKRRDGRWVAIAVAGTSDLPVAEEAAFTLDALGLESQIIADIGVAGIHRLLRQLETLREASVLLAVAGMEWALPSVVAGLVSAPVVAVPTSIGYGASFGGVAALIGMLNSCSPGISVVNIDNGFGAAVVAARIINLNHSHGGITRKDS